MVAQHQRPLEEQPAPDQRHEQPAQAVGQGQDQEGGNGPDAAADRHLRPRVEHEARDARGDGGHDQRQEVEIHAAPAGGRLVHAAGVEHEAVDQHGPDQRAPVVQQVLVADLEPQAEIDRAQLGQHDDQPVAEREEQVAAGNPHAAMENDDHAASLPRLNPPPAAGSRPAPRLPRSGSRSRSSGSSRRPRRCPCGPDRDC